MVSWLRATFAPEILSRRLAGWAVQMMGSILKEPEGRAENDRDAIYYRAN
jgi:hypothetical protein